MPNRQFLGAGHVLLVRGLSHLDRATHPQGAVSGVETTFPCPLYALESLHSKWYELLPELVPYGSCAALGSRSS